MRNLAKEGAVVFGDHAAKLRKNQARPRRDKVKSQPEKTKIIVAAAEGIQVGRAGEARVDEDRSSGTAHGQDYRDSV
jgi:hypothetical protein